MSVLFISVGKHGGRGGCPNLREICYKMIWFKWPSMGILNKKCGNHMERVNRIVHEEPEDCYRVEVLEGAC